MARGSSDETRHSPSREDRPDLIGVFLRLLLVASALTGALFSVVAFAHCEFLSYERPRALPPLEELSIDEMLSSLTPHDEVSPSSSENQTSSPAPSPSPPAIVQSATLGLLLWNPNGQGCRRYEEALYSLPTSFLVARACGVLAALLGILALGIILLEFVCCRFTCSRYLFVFFLLLAFLAQSITFIVYVSEYCTPSGRSEGYACDYESGSSSSIIATCLFFCSMFLACPAPQAKPLIRNLLEKDESDPCCYCWRRKTLQGHEKDGDDKEDDTVDKKKEKPRNHARTEDEEDPAHGNVSNRVAPNVLLISHQDLHAQDELTVETPPAYQQTSNNEHPVPVFYASRQAALRNNSPKELSPPVNTAPVGSFRNAEVYDEDLFFDSKTI